MALAVIAIVYLAFLFHQVAFLPFLIELSAGMLGVLLGFGLDRLIELDKTLAVSKKIVEYK